MAVGIQQVYILSPGNVWVSLWATGHWSTLSHRCWGRVGHSNQRRAELVPSQITTYCKASGLDGETG